MADWESDLAALPSHDNIAELLGVNLPSFEALHKKALQDVKRDIMAYVKKCKSAANMPVDDVTDTVFLKYNEAGFPSVYGFKTGSTIPKKELEDLLRTYLRRHYCEYYWPSPFAAIVIFFRSCIRWQG